MRWSSLIFDFHIDYEPPSEVTVNGCILDVEGYDMLGRQGWFNSLYTPCTKCHEYFNDEQWCLHVYGEQPWSEDNLEWAMVPCYSCETMRMISRGRRF